MNELNRQVNNAECLFTASYFDYDLSRREEFRCHMVPLGSNQFCIYHDPNFLHDQDHPENREIVLNRLFRQIDNTLADEEPLFCIGYHIPSFEMTMSFNRPVYFSWCKFFGLSLDHTSFFSSVSFFWC